MVGRRPQRRGGRLRRRCATSAAASGELRSLSVVAEAHGPRPRRVARARRRARRPQARHRAASSPSPATPATSRATASPSWRWATCPTSSRPIASRGRPAAAPGTPWSSSCERRRHRPPPSPSARRASTSRPTRASRSRSSPATAAGSPIDAGREYLDLVAGIAVDVLGHAHPAITEAVARQAATLLQVSNLYYTLPQLELAEALVARSPFDRVFFTNSGHGGERGGDQARAASRRRARRARDRQPRRLVPRPNARLAGGHRPAEVPGAVRARCRPASGTSRRTTSTPSTRRSPMRPAPSCWSRSWARAASIP